MSDTKDKTGDLEPGKPGTAQPAADEIHPTETIPPPVTQPSLGSSEPRPQSANMLAGRYELVEQLGQGGMGVVYRAHDLELEEDLAIKLLQRQFTLNADDVRRFKREIKTARRITHPNIIRIHDFGVDGDDAFISMEILSGGTLAERLSSRVTLEEGMRIAIEISDGLAAAHRKGVIHRDIKPSNVLFDSEGTVKIVDFGIARFAASATLTAGLQGTPHYMSPEQADGRDVGKFSDVYSLGVVLYEMFTGRLPFRSNSLAKLAVMHVSQTPDPPTTVNPDLPDEIAQIVTKCLEKDPHARYADAIELAQALREARGKLGIHAGPTLPSVAHYEADTGDVSIVRPAKPHPPQRRRVGLWLIALGVVVVGGVAGWQGGLLDGVLGVEPTPTATQVVAGTTLPVTTESTPETTPTAAVIASPVATPKPTATRRVRRTPKPTPKPTPTPFRFGLVQVKTVPRGVVYIDNKLVDKERQAQHPAIRVKPGTHTIRAVYVVPGQPKHEMTTKVKVVGGQLTTLILQVPEKRVLKNDTSAAPNPDSLR